MKNIFLEIINMSITASWIVLGVILLRFIFKKAPKWITVLLWGVLGLRLIFPFSFESVYSLLPSSKVIYTDVYTTRPYIETGFSGVDRVINDNLVGVAGVTVRHDYYTNLYTVLSILWIIGIAAMVGYAVFSYLKVKSRVSASINLHDNIYICDDIQTPFILGIIKPKIYLPSCLSEETAQFVIAHEKAHLKRRDHLWKPLGFALLSIHWFNPILWLSYILLCRDIESACDEAVLKRMGSEVKEKYSEALLSCGTRQRTVTVCPLAFGEVGLKARIKSVLNYRKPAFWLIICAAVICTAVSVGLLTNPSSKFEDITGGFNEAQIIDANLSGELIYSEDTDYIKNITDALKKVRITKNPISYNRSEDRDKTNTLTFDYNTSLHFNSDFSSVWVSDSVKPSLTYAVRNPDVLRKLFDTENLPKNLEISSGSELDGVDIDITEINLTDENPYISVTFNRERDKDIFYGESFMLYYLENGEWVDTAVTERVFTDIAYEPSESTLTFTHNFGVSLQDMSKQGLYRFETNIHRHNDTTSYKVWAEFELVTGTHTATAQTLSPDMCCYEDGLYEPATPVKDRTYRFINRNMLMEYSRTESYWKAIGNVAEYTLTKENFDIHFDSEWNLKLSPAAFRKQAKTVYKIDPMADNGYYLLIEQNDAYYLGEFTNYGCMWLYSLADVNVNSSFTATVLEVNKKMLLVTPDENSSESKSADKIYISTDIISADNSTVFKVGDKVRIVYNGEIAESYPAFIGTVFVIYKTE